MKKILKRILKVLGYFLLFLILVGSYIFGLRYYHLNVTPEKELKAFTGKHLKYPLVNGQLQIPKERFNQFTVTDSAQWQNFFMDSISSRKVISLNGTWQIAEGDELEIPTTFEHTAPVPGFADQANPAFEAVGETKTKLLRLLFHPKDAAANLKFEDPKRRFFWYKRSFVIDGEVPANAFLKVHRAQYGSEIWLNGQKVGFTGRNYQPGLYNVTSHLKGNNAENEVVIRVGTSIDSKSGNNKNTFGDAMEKQKHLPGVYDNVELLLSGATRIEKIQVVPHIQDSVAQVVAWVKNYGPKDSVSFGFTVKDYKNPLVVGQVATDTFLLDTGEEKIVEVYIPIKDCKLWSPEHPNLYMLVAKSETDELHTRFGMRKFHFDTKTKVPILNGKPYYLRGTNIPFFRYAENPYRKSEVWDEQWIKGVYGRFKELNWNSLRFHVGPAPSAWYKVADEEGIFVQDEYTIWGWKLQRDGVVLDTLVSEYVGWMENQWNHASVLMWDSQNETTVEPRSGYAMQVVRNLDLSNRPWDNGWDKSYSDTDTWEAHPYIHNETTMALPWQDIPDYTLSSLNGKDPNGTYLHEGKPVMVNEYSWMWLDREGNPTPLTQNLYDHSFPNSTAQDRFEQYGYDCAAQTEHYRALRAAGVQQFSGLSSNYPGSKTTDIFRDAIKLEIEPTYIPYLKSAFSPIGICIYDWSDGFGTGEKVKFPIVMVNDTYEDWEGEVVISLENKEKTVYDHTAQAKVVATGKTIFEVAIDMPGETGDYELVASFTDNKGEEVRSIRKYLIKADTP